MEQLDRIATTCKLFNDIRVLEQRREIERLKVKLLISSTPIFHLNKLIYNLLTTTDKTRKYIIEKAVECGLKCDDKYLYTFTKLIIVNNTRSMDFFKLVRENKNLPDLKDTENYLKFYFVIQKETILSDDNLDAEKKNIIQKVTYDEWINMLLCSNIDSSNIM